MEKRWKDMAETAAKALLDHRAQDVLLLDTSEMTVVCDGFLLASGRATIQVRALCDAVEEAMLEKWQTSPARVDGYAGGRWIALDYSGLIIHIFHTEDREFYRLEKLWDRTVNRTPFLPEEAKA